MQMRVYAESAAFYQAGEVEQRKTNQKLDQLISTQRKLIHWEYALNCEDLFCFLSLLFSSFDQKHKILKRDFFFFF